MSSEVLEVMCGDKVCGVVEDGRYTSVIPAIEPLFLTRGGAFRDWVSRRAISSSRGLSSRNIKRASGLSASALDYESAMRVHAACMTDNFWVREQGATLCYREVSFRDYEGEMLRLALGFDSDHRPYISDKSSPELTNIGNSQKAWYVEEGARWLYKRQPLRECYQEILASKVAQALGIDTVRYELVDASEPDPFIGQYGVIRSRDFTQERHVNLEHALGVVEDENDVRGCAMFFAEYGFAQAYLDLIYLDLITGNPDRHGQNFGVLRDPDTGAMISLAPNYDNNFAFMSRDVMEPKEFAAIAGVYGWQQPLLTEEDVDRLVAEMETIGAGAAFNTRGCLGSVIRMQEKVRNTQ